MPRFPLAHHAVCDEGRSRFWQGTAQPETEKLLLAPFQKERKEKTMKEFIGVPISVRNWTITPIGNWIHLQRHGFQSRWFWHTDWEEIGKLLDKIPHLQAAILPE